MKPLLLLVCLLAWLGSAAAQDERYHVEVIVFAHDSSDDPLYRWPGMPDVESALDLWPDRASDLDNRVFSDRQSAVSPLLPASSLFEPLTAEQQIMHREWQNLGNAGQYRPLLQLAWQQPAASFGDPQPVRVRGGAIIHRPLDSRAGLLLGQIPAVPIYEVDGIVALERGRYLHLRVDVTLNQAPSGRPPHRSDLATLERPAYYQTWRITERRQVTTGAINYFDHRHFGLIALVREIEPAPESTAR